MDHIDKDGYRANVGIIVTDGNGLVLLGGRFNQNGWQFPQGGIRVHETPEQAMYRELAEEIGLSHRDVELIGETHDWLRYRLPNRYIRKNTDPVCIGQKQRWFMLRLVVDDDAVRFDRSDKPEFDRIRWVDFWRPVSEVIYFKRRVYAQALHELGSALHADSLPPRPRWWPKRWRSVFDKDIEAGKLSNSVT